MRFLFTEKAMNENAEQLKEDTATQKSCAA